MYIVVINIIPFLKGLITMEHLINNFDQSEKTITFLKEQLNILNALAAKKQQEREEVEKERLQRENEALRKDLSKLKDDLRFYEVQNGVAQVSLPLNVQSSAATKTIKIEQEVPTQEKKECAESQSQPKQKKRKNEGKAKTPPAKAAEERPIDASRLNMKVGKIVNVEKHPDADTLYVEEVDIGEEKNRTVVSGLVKYFTLEQMQGRIALFLCNLKPAKMRGILSEGMIMCAETPENCEILEVPEGAVIGERVVCEGYPGEPDEQLNAKKKIWEQIRPDLAVRDDGIPAYKGAAFTIVGKGVCKAPTLTNCIVK